MGNKIWSIYNDKYFEIRTIYNLFYLILFNATTIKLLEAQSCTNCQSMWFARDTAISKNSRKAHHISPLPRNRSPSLNVSECFLTVFQNQKPVSLSDAVELLCSWQPLTFVFSAVFCTIRFPNSIGLVNRLIENIVVKVNY